MRIAIRVVVLAVLGTALTACGSGPSQVNSAVIIGDRVVSVDDVQRRLDSALKSEPAAKDLAKNHKLDLVSRGIVSQLVRHELLEAAATRENVTVSERDVAQFVAQGAPSEDPVQRSVDAGFDANMRARDRLLAQALGHKYLEKLMVTFDGVVLDTADAKQKASELATKVAAQPGKAAEMFQAAAPPQRQPFSNYQMSSVQGYSLAAGQQPVLVAPLFGVPLNSAFAFSLGGGQQEGGGSGAWLVGLVKQRSLNATLPQEETAIVPQVAPAWSEIVGQYLAGPLMGDLGVRISPRYGVWDELAVAVAPSEAEKVGVVVPAASARP